MGHYFVDTRYLRLCIYKRNIKKNLILDLIQFLQSKAGNNSTMLIFQQHLINPIPNDVFNGPYLPGVYGNRLTD